MYWRTRLPRFRTHCGGVAGHHESSRSQSACRPHGLRTWGASPLPGGGAESRRHL